MKIQFIVTHYKEGQQCIERLLDSFKLQQDINFDNIELIIENDGNEVILDTTNFNRYPFKISYYVEEWSGPSGVRQHGMDRCNADYIMFCDGDDLLYRNNALWSIFNTIKKNNYPDVVTSQFTTDLGQDTGGAPTEFKTYNNENVWIHGKAWKLSFLKQYNIHWDVNLHWYEDCFFVRSAFAHTNSKVNISETLWFWKSRPESLTRHDGQAVEKNYDVRIDSNAALVRKLRDDGLRGHAANYVFVQLFETYFQMQESIWNSEEYKPLRKKVIQKLKLFYLEFKPLLTEISLDCQIVIMETLRKRFYTDKHRLSIETITFVDWMNRVLNDMEV